MSARVRLARARAIDGAVWVLITGTWDRMVSVNFARELAADLEAACRDAVKLGREARRRPTRRARP